MTRSLVAIDTSVLLEWMKAANPPYDTQSWRDAQSLQALKDHDFVIPAPALSEALVKLTRSTRVTVARELERKYDILPFDRNAALLAAEYRGVAEGERTATRQAAKIDDFILACAVRHKCNALATTDPEICKVASRALLALRVATPADLVVQPAFL